MSRVEARPVPPGQRLVADLPVQHYGRVPLVDARTWTLVVRGSAAGDVVLTWEDLLALPRTSVVADQHCVSRLTVQDVAWAGVAVRDVLALAPPPDGAHHTLVTAEFGYSTSVALPDLASPRALLATHRHDEPLTAERGGPVRLVVPHLYAWKGPKWVREIAYVDHPVAGFWEQRGYHLVGDAWRQERYSYQS